MKKLNKLCAILFAVLGVQTLSAQKDVTDTYLKNAGFEDGTNNWTYGGSGTNYGGVAAYGSSTTYNSVTLISVDKFGESKGNALHTSAGWGSPSFYTQEVTLPAGDYKLTFDVINCNSSATRITNRFGWVPNSGTAIYSSVSDIIYNAWQTISVTFTLNTETTGKISVGMVSTSGSGSGVVAKLFTDNVRIFKMDEDSEATIAKPIDYSDLINQSTWSFAEDDGSGSSSSLTTNVNKGEWPYRMAERYRGVGGHYGKKLYQTISLPSGVYQVQAACMSAHANGVEGGNALPDGTLDNAYFYANDEEVTYALANATSTFQKNIVTLDNEGTIEFGVKTVARGANWNAIGCATVIKVANSYEEYLQDLLGELYTERQTLISELEALQSEIPEPYNSNTVSPAIEKANNATTQETLTEANNALKNILTNAEKMVAPYADAKALFTICENILNNSQEFVDGAETTFSSAVNSAKTNVEAATTADAINNVISDLEDARQTYVVKADPISDTYFDYTFLMTNPAVANGDGWTGARTNSGEQYTGAPDNTYWDSWNGAGQNIYQELTGLPSGLYTLKAAGRASVSCTSAYIYLNDTKAEIDKAGNTGNDLGNGWKWYTTEKTAVAGTAKVGFGCNTASSQWAGADDFHLYYYGFDVATAQNGVTTLKEEAEALVGKPMNADVASALQAAIDDADATKTTRNELNSMIDALSTAVNAANASIAEYEKIATYIAKANTIDGSIAADVQTRYDNCTLEEAEPVFQALEVATYDYVTENFNYAVAIESTWNSTGTNTSAKEFSNEHWSGETRGYMNQNDDNGQGWNANSWSLDFDQEVSLPAGEYVFKVAGRKSAAATLELVVTMGETILGIVSDFPNGSTGLGINKAGEASFDPNDQFARDNNTGFGWQWRYVKFELAEESLVKIAVHAEANAHGNWVSFGDYTLQMTEDTYLAANMGALDAPTAAANALVDSKPMGTDENEALKVALALPLETGAHLLAKIDALNTAVANANAWVVEYNNAKAPLVAAFERFETDFNDAQNGALDHMNKDRWAYAVEMAQAAAVAKDVTDSYDGFESAAGNLNDALDAATVSINEYASLKAAIDEANTVYEGDDWGSEPFQRPESAMDDFNAIKTTAQNAYDAAEVDGEGVTAVIESLNNTVNGIVLNAPEEGQRFNIKVATEGHGKNGNAWLMTLGNAGDNNPTGYGINANNAVQPHLNQAFIFTQVEGNLYNISIERPEGTVYLTYGSLNGSAAGWKNQQIQATTDAEKKGEFKIVPTGKNGILKIFNTVDNNYLDCQDGGAIYTDTGISNEEFAFELAEEHTVTLNISAAGWATLILPFNAEIPDGVTVYGSDMIDGDLLKLSEAGSIVANTPYLVNGTEDTYNFSGYGLAEEGSYADGNGFVGTYVEYATAVGDYVLQKQGNAVAFYVVGESAQPTVKPYRCYLTVPTSEIKAFFIFDDGATGINGVDAAGAEIEAIYTVNGVKVNSLQKGLNIVKMSNGKTQKVMVP